jgi:hypothetical protein
MAPSPTQKNAPKSDKDSDIDFEEHLEVAGQVINVEGDSSDSDGEEGDDPTHMVS